MECGKREQPLFRLSLGISLRIGIPRGYSSSSLLRVYHCGMDSGAETDKHFATRMKNNLPLVLFLPILALSIDIRPLIFFETCILQTSRSF